MNKSFEGYEVAHSEEWWAGSMLGKFAILVKLSNRQLGEHDDFYDVARQIRRKLDTVSAELDPKGPAEREAYKVEIADIYQRAGVEAIYMEPLRNGYCPEPCCLNKPWFRVTSKIGHVVIGWRKRVISIDWKDTVLKDRSGEELFPDEKVTRLETGIHAWGVDAAVKYIQHLHASVSGQ